MSLIPLILSVEISLFPGSLKVNFDYFVYPASGESKIAEFSYEIPFASLTFVRDGANFVAHYRVGVEVFDGRRNIVATEVWDRYVTVQEYSLTNSRDSCAKELISFSVPASAFEGMVSFYDLHSERQAKAMINLEGRKEELRLRTFKSGQPNPSRIYGLEDTIEIIAEFVGKDSEVIVDDSILWVVKRGKRNFVVKKEPVVNSSRWPVSRLVIPVVDKNRTLDFSSGSYWAEACLVSQNCRGAIEFKLDLPFYYDDSLWVLKVDQLLYIATPEEMRRLKKASRSTRQQIWQEFWRERDPNPSTELNELENEYFARIEYCEKKFKNGDRGYRSDRAMIYVLYGPPDQVESRSFEIDRPAEEIWYYYQRNLSFVFVDRYGVGEYILKKH